MCVIERLQNEHRVREEDLLTSLTATIEANRFSPVFGETLKDLFAHVLKKGQRGHQKEIQTLLAQIEQLDRRKSKLYDLFTIEEIDKFELVSGNTTARFSYSARDGGRWTRITTRSSIKSWKPSIFCADCYRTSMSFAVRRPPVARYPHNFSKPICREPGWSC